MADPISLLDNLYEPGFGTVLTGALVTSGGPGQLDVVDLDGTLHVTFDWASGQKIAIDCQPTSVLFSYLSTTCGGRREADAATYRLLCESLPSIFKSVGVTIFTATPQDAESSKVLQSYGGFAAQGNRLIWTL